MAIPFSNSVEPESRAKPGGGRRLLWEVYQSDFDTWMMAHVGGGGLIILVLGAFAGAVGPKEAFPVAALGALIALIIALAAGSLGAFVGFLFGLPRTLTSNELRGARNPEPETGDAPAPEAVAATGSLDEDPAPEAPVAKATDTTGTVRSSYTDVNTNLEQISDWLTKIIVGVGLTQLNSIPREIDAFGDRVSVYFVAGGKALGIGTGLYCLILGFFLAYVGTRVRLSLVFTASQRNNDNTGNGNDPMGSTAHSMFLEAANASPIEGAGDTSLRLADDAVLSRSLTELTSLSQLRARANALARSSSPTGPMEARDLYEHILKRAPVTPELLSDYAQVLGLTGQGDKAQEVLGTVGVLSSPQAKDEAARKVGEAELRGEVLAGLYGRDGKNYDHAIAKLEELAKLPGKDRDLWVHIWSACAHGQRYAATRQDADRAIVAEEVDKALRIEPARKAYLASLYYPNLVRNGEDDLVSLYPDEALDALLAPDTPTP